MNTRVLRKAAMRRWVGRSSAIAAWIVATEAHAGALPIPSFQGMGDLPGGTVGSRALGVSADGSTVVGYSASELGSEAFRWTHAEGIVGLGSAATGYIARRATAVSADGSVIVGSGERAGGGGTEAFRWTAASGIQQLGDFGGGAFSSGAQGVSADGSVVVGYGTPFGGERAFRWTANNGMTNINSPPAATSHAYAVSADGTTVAGYKFLPATSFEPFRWTQSTGMQGLGSFGIAYGISGDGAYMAGGIGDEFGGHAVRWTSDGQEQDLGRLVPGESSGAYAASFDGSVVVGWGSTPLQQASVWTEATGMRRLSDILTIDLGLDLTGWSLREALGVSADGLTIVGWGRYQGAEQGFIAVIPSPGGFTIFAAGLCAALRRRR